MRKLLYIFILSSLLLSCRNSCEVDTNFENTFKLCISKVNERDLYVGLITDSLRHNFHFSIKYLEELTSINANFQWNDILPYYESRSQCKKDIRDWEKWYNDNKCQITKFYSDSIKLSVLRGFYGGVSDEELKLWLNSLFYKDILP
jgi:hypothetical protein